MDFQSSDRKQWFNLTCKSSDRPTFIELSECNISLGNLLDSLYRNFSTKYQLIFRKSTLYEISRYKLFYKFESVGNNNENSRLEITINKFNVGIGLSADVCKMPSKEQESFTDIDILTKSSQLIYPCPKNDIIVTNTGSLTTDSTIIITTPFTTESKDESTLSTAAERSASTNIHRLTINSQNYEVWNKGSTSHKDEESRTTSTTTISIGENATRVFNHGSETKKNEFFNTEKAIISTESDLNLKSHSNRSNITNAESKVINNEITKSEESQQSKLSLTTGSFDSNYVLTSEMSDKLMFLKHLEIKDYALLGLMVVAVAIMVVEIKSRRKISKRLRNFLFHV
ncbi:hypothetical protein RF11_14509 [Thelohanellus kitauei]|uniref:Uncharacterized protein n=1 Tax=Thelohanellus kitauei TaxID=669202 RepID=A0A0C2NEI7_THEKT|nr:hypothetical protein RF11_14509 [Thelohanellus kitauei]